MNSRERGEYIYAIQDAVMRNEARRYSDASSFIEELNVRSQESLQVLTQKINALIQSEDYSSDLGKKYRVQLMRKLRQQLRLFTQELGGNLTGNTLNFLINAYQSSYHESGEVLGMNTSFSMPPKQAIIEAINYPWSGDMWSNRVWTNVEAINKQIEQLVVRALMTGEGDKDIAKLINRDLVMVGQKIKYVTERIIRTEMARVNYVADVKCWKDLGVTKVQFLAYIDSDTSDFCRKHNDKIYELGQEPKLPAHPHCRSCYVPYLEEVNWEERINNAVKVSKEKAKKKKEESKPKEKPFVDVAKLDDDMVTIRNEVSYIEKGEDKYIKEYNNIKSQKELDKYLKRMEDLYESGELSSNFYNGFLDDVKTIQRVKSKILVDGDYRVAFTKGDVALLEKDMNTKAFFDSLSDDDKAVIKKYTGSDYREMNGYLRKLRKLATSETKKACADLKEVLGRGELTKDTLLFRGADIDVFKDDFIDKLMDNPQSVIGSTVKDLGFMSTSINSSSAFDKDITFQILAPSGTKGAYIKEYSQFSHESEFLLQANTELEIVAVKQGRTDLNYTMFCRVKSQG